MGKLNSGLQGSFGGQVGKVVGSSWKGIPYIKSAYKSRTKKISKKEVANRNKFGMAQEWLKPLLPFVREGFKGYSETVEGYLAAKSWLLRNCFTGDGSNIRIDPALMKVSSGELLLPGDMTVGQTKAGHLQFTWDSTPIPETSGQDQAMLLAYDVENKVAWYTLTGQFRSVGSDTLEIDTKPGRTYQVYLAFTAADRTRQSDSAYLGELKL